MDKTKGGQDRVGSGDGWGGGSGGGKVETTVLEQTFLKSYKNKNKI